MILRSRIKRPQVLISAGLFSLAGASICRFLIFPRGPVPAAWGDAVMGLGYGVAIGLMLVGLYWQTRLAAGKRGPCQG